VRLASGWTSKARLVREDVPQPALGVRQPLLPVVLRPPSGFVPLAHAAEVRQSLQAGQRQEGKGVGERRNSAAHLVRQTHLDWLQRLRLLFQLETGLRFHKGISQDG